MRRYRTPVEKGEAKRQINASIGLFDILVDHLYTLILSEWQPAQ